MVVHDVEDLAGGGSGGSESSYGEGTMLVQRVSKPPSLPGQGHPSPVSSSEGLEGPGASSVPR